MFLFRKHNFLNIFYACVQKFKFSDVFDVCTQKQQFSKCFLCFYAETIVSSWSGRAWPDNSDIPVHFVRPGLAGQFGHPCPFCPAELGRTIRILFISINYLMNVN